MPKFLIERNIPGAGKLNPEQLQGVSQKSCSVLRGLGPEIQWVQSYVTDDKITCETGWLPCGRCAGNSDHHRSNNQ
jgi:hypothetical protein